MCCPLFAALILQACTYAPQAEKGILKKPDLAKAALYNVQLGLGYLQQGDRPRAKEKLLTALEQEPDSPDTNSAIAYYFEQTDQLSYAEKYYLKALSLAPHSGTELNNYGAFLCRRSDYKKAERYFLNAVEDIHYLNTAAAYENAGLCALSASNENKAMLYFAKALNHDSFRNVSLYELIRLNNKMGHYAEAFALVQQHEKLIHKDKALLKLAETTASRAGKAGYGQFMKNKAN